MSVFSPKVEAALAEAKSQYTNRKPRSQAHFVSDATQKMPGGSTRNSLANPPFPIFIQRGWENRLLDIDGHEYLDVFGDATAGIYGHSHPVIQSAVKRSLETGLKLGAHLISEARFAETVCERFGFDMHGADTACAILEVMLGGGGCIPVTREFVNMLREEARRLGVCLILYEVMTSRLSPGGIAPLYAVVPDLKTLGKSVGGGTSFGSWGGSRRFMSIYDMRNPTAIPHAGTYNNNTLLMTVGQAALTEPGAYTKENCARLNEYGDKLRVALNEVARKYGAPMVFTGMGSMIGTHFTDKKETSFLVLREPLFFDLNVTGIWASRGGTMSLSLPFLDHGDSDARRVVEAVEEWVVRRREVLELFKVELRRTAKL
ncbi:PLP-dependent transferase [Gonapodya prolifera JEL478]|uniref:PLP-dependent transferase n=1 Tax=Gonapodya prolifera (strain JEL478) TaxID=1344416 RepID=A0A139AF52_GONPJ|nr:PLP-dependent transferase [Gonapodya prolifera JEL478]|eukprot:KXS15441.1 PLP-dependent transferase [Gonapodya prolifera JEL478]